MRHAFYTLITPELTPEDAIATAVRYGFDGLEWRVASPKEPRVGECNYWDGNRCSLESADLDRSLPGLISSGRASGILPVSLCAYHRPYELTSLARLFAIASSVGIPMVRVSVPAYDRSRSYHQQFEDLRRQSDHVEVLARKHGVRACYLQHAGTLLPSASACYRLLEGRDPAHLGLFLDVGHFVREGYEDFGIVMDLVAPWVAEIHLRNGWMTSVAHRVEGQGRSTPRWCSLDDGQVPFELLADTLGRHGWDGWLVLEDFSDRPEVQRLTEGIATMRRMETIAARHRVQAHGALAGELTGQFMGDSPASHLRVGR